MYAVTLVPIALSRVSSRANSGDDWNEHFDETTLSMRHASVRLFNSFVASFSRKVTSHVTLLYLHAICEIFARSFFSWYMSRCMYMPMHTYIESSVVFVWSRKSIFLIDRERNSACLCINDNVASVLSIIMTLIHQRALNMDETSLYK